MAPDVSKVYIGKVNSNHGNLLEVVLEALSHFEDHLKKIRDAKSKSIIIKPNILPTEYLNDGLPVTHPKLCEIVADYLISIGFTSIYLAEGTTYNKNGVADTLEAMKNYGFSEPHMVHKWKQFDLNLDEVGIWFEIYSPGDEGNPSNPFDIEIGISRFALSFPIISCAKMKAHDVLGLTLSIKNLMGCLCKARRKSTGEILDEGPKVKSYLHGYGSRNPYQLPDINLNFTSSKTALAININRMAKHLMPILSVIDAFPAMEGNGPIRGKANSINYLFCSNDPVAVDSVACQLSGINLDYNQYILNLSRLGLGHSKLNAINIINNNLYVEFKKSGSFLFHEWFKQSKFSSEEIELLKKFTK